VAALALLRERGVGHDAPARDRPSPDVACETFHPAMRSLQRKPGSAIVVELRSRPEALDPVTALARQSCVALRELPAVRVGVAGGAGGLAGEI